MPKELEESQDALHRANDQSQEAEEVQRPTVSHSVDPGPPSPQSPPSPSSPPSPRSTPPTSSCVPETVIEDLPRPNEHFAGNNQLTGRESAAENTGSS
jgi:hypothetical protein